MSLILEALRKSEAERQLGRAPGLLTPMPSAACRRPRWLAIAAVVPMLALVAAGGWWFGRGSGAEPAPSSPSAARGVPAPSAEPDRSAIDAPPAAAAPASQRPAAASATPSPATPEPVRSTATPASSTNALPPIAAATAATPAAGGPTAPAEPQPPLDDAAPAAVTAASAVASEPSLPAVPLLDADTRRRLPPLRMSIHVYAEQPEQRFALIDGHRYGEGQHIDDTLEVSEIRRDGVVLTVDGQPYLLPRQ